MIFTYSIVIVAIAITMALFFTLSNSTQNAVPGSCSIYGTLGCSDVAFVSNTQGARLIILATSQVYGKVNISAFNAVVGGVKSTSGYCTTNMIEGGSTQMVQGQQISCIAVFPTPSATFAPQHAYTGTFNISGNYCPSGTGKCLSGNAYNFRGNFRTFTVSSMLITTTATATLPTTGECGYNCQSGPCNSGYTCARTHDITCASGQGYSCRPSTTSTSTTTTIDQLE